MAFSTANIRPGIAGDKRVVTGIWTGADGDAEGTYTVKGRVFDASFRTQASTGPGEIPNVRWSQNSTTGVTTITVPYRETVSAGTFKVVFV